MLCSDRQLGGVSYAEYAGIMADILAFGTIADRIDAANNLQLRALSHIILDWKSWSEI